MIRSMILAATLATSGWAAVAHAGQYDGPARWESTTVTISADLEQTASHWGDTLKFEVVPANEAQIKTTSQAFTDKGVGGEAQSTFRNGDYLESCTIALPKGKQIDSSITTHEFGHCLGLSHRSGVDESNMHWWAQDYTGGWSDTVTEADLAALAERYER